MKKLLCILSLLVFSTVVFADFSIVQDGNPVATVVLDATNATRSAQLAAAELIFHIRNLTGATLPLVVRAEDARTQNLIVLGGRDADMFGDASKIAFQGNVLRIYGNDTPNMSKVVYEDEKTFPALEEECKGTLFAVYDFLELYCGVRFFGVHNSDTYYPKKGTLAVRVQDRSHESPMDAFRYVYVDDRNEFKTPLTPRELALFRFRWRNTVHYGLVNHNHYSIYFHHWGKATDPRLAPVFEGQNKDMFAKGFDGKNHSVDPLLRSNYPNDRDIPPQICYSSPDAVQYYVNEVLAYARGGSVIGGWRNWRGQHSVTEDILPHVPGKPYFYPIQGGDTGGYCLCERCLKRFPKDTAENVSDNKFQFMADVANAVAKIDPTAGVATEGYIQTLAYPQHVQLPTNLSVMLCLTQYSWWHPIAREFQLGAYKEWVRKEASRLPITVYTYLFSTQWDARHHYGDYKPFPGFYPQHTIEQFEMFVKDGVRGWFTEVEMRYQFLEAYLASRICYDPSLDPQTLLKEFFALYYGDAGDAMAAIYQEIESGYWNDANCEPAWLDNHAAVMSPKGKKHPYWTTGIWSQQICWEKLGTPQRLAKINGWLEEAKRKVKTPEEKLHLQHFLDYLWEPALQGEKDYQRLQKLRSQPAASLPLFLQQDADGNPEAIQWANVPATGRWKNLSGEESPMDCSLKATRDSSFLYLRFQENAPAPQSAEMWRDDVELFFVPLDKKYALQLAVSPTGEMDQLKHVFSKSGRQMEFYDFQAKTKLLKAADHWCLLVAIPLAKLPLTHGCMLANFFRIVPKGSCCWSPIYENRFVDGIPNYGFLNSLPDTIEENEFTLYHPGEASGTIQDKKAANGKAAWMMADQSWAIMVRTDNLGIRGKAKLQVAIRTDAPAQAGGTTGVGLYNRKTNRQLKYVPIPVDKIAGETYVTIDLGEIVFSDETYLFVKSITPKTSASTKIYVDHFKLN